MKRLLLLGGGLQGLSCGDSLRNEGFVVDVVSNELQIKKSCFFKKVYSDGYKSTDESVLKILKESHYDVVIPMGDMNVSRLSQHKEQIEHELDCKCACPTQDELRQVEDKHLFMQFCKANSIPHPKTRPLNDNDLDRAAEEVGFPALIKPDFSVGARGITRVDSVAELKEKYPAVKEKFGECTLQELIDNKDYYYNVMLYRNREGRILAHTIIKIVRMYPIEAGSSTCCVSIEDDKLLAICEYCLKKLDWVGMADFDVLQRKDNGEYKIIEINPRVPASLRAAQISGVNFPEIIALDAMGEAVSHYNYMPGKVLRYMGTDLMWMLKSGKVFKAQPSWFKFYGRNLSYQDIYASDPSTWWTWLAEGIMKIKKRNKRLR